MHGGWLNIYIYCGACFNNGDGGVQQQLPSLLAPVDGIGEVKVWWSSHGTSPTG